MSYGEQIEKGRPLTEKQREYLRDQHEPPNDNAEYQMRSKIRARVEGALSDFSEANKLSDNDAQKLFEGAGEITTEGTTINPPEGGSHILPGLPYEISSIIALACRGYQENGIEPQEFVSSRVATGITMAIADAKGIDPNRVSVEINTSVTIHENSPLEKIEKGIPLTGEEWQEVMNLLNEEIDRDFRGENLVDLAKEHLIEDDE